MAVEMDWRAADEVPATPANVFLLQGVGEELIFVFGHAPPPVAVSYMDSDQKAKYFADHPVRVSQIVRLSMTLSTAKFVLENLKVNLENDDDADMGERRDEEPRART